MALDRSSNGWQNQGKVINWSFGKLKGNDFLVYSYIVRMSIGYGQTTTVNLSNEYIAKQLGISKRTTGDILRRLLELNFLRRPKSNTSKEAFKNAYKYSLNFKVESDFPFIVGLVDSKEDKVKQSNEPQYTCLDGTKIPTYYDYKKRLKTESIQSPSIELSEYCKSKGLNAKEELIKWETELTG